MFMKSFATSNETKLYNMKEQYFIVKIAGQYIVFTSGEYELYLYFGKP